MLTLADCRVADLAAITGTPKLLSDYPHAGSVVLGVPVYDCAALRAGAPAEADARKP
jgi:hypothetical protein